jgi:hypothetical protein
VHFFLVFLKFLRQFVQLREENYQLCMMNNAAPDRETPAAESVKKNHPARRASQRP